PMRTPPHAWACCVSGVTANNVSNAIVHKIFLISFSSLDSPSSWKEMVHIQISPRKEDDNEKIKGRSSTKGTKNTKGKKRKSRQVGLTLFLFLRVLGVLRG